MTEKLSLEEFLGKRGLRDPISGYMQDKTIFPHGLTARQRKQLEKDAFEHSRKYHEKGLLPYGNITNWWKVARSFPRQGKRLQLKQPVTGIQTTPLQKLHGVCARNEVGNGKSL